MIVNINDVQIQLHDKGDLVVRELKNKRKGWEKETLQNWVNYAATSDGIVLDIGAYNGIFGFLAEKKDNKVIAFEALKRNYESVLKNRILNNSKLDVKNIALGNENKELKLYTTTSFEHPSVSTLNAKAIPKHYKEFEIVQVRTLDSLNITGKVSLIKIDVERFEKQVLEGGEKLLSNDKPVIFIELLEKDLKDDVFNFLYNIGYTHFYAIDDKNNLTFKINNITEHNKEIRNYIIH